MFNRCIYLVYLVGLLTAFAIRCSDSEHDGTPVDADSGLAPDADSDGDSAPDTDDPQVPELTPIASEVALQLGSYVRRLKVRAADHDPYPVAWAFVNVSCEERALALEWAIATADPSLDGDPQTMDEAELTRERIQEVADNPSFDVASINITGPMVAEQYFIQPDGTEVGEMPFTLFWTYHHGAALNVDGTIKVLDLSQGDEPIDIDTWYSALVEPDVECFPMGNKEWQDVWIYWNSVLNGFELPPEPNRLCGYTITPMFKMRWDLPIQFDQLGWTPSTMEVQTLAFMTTLSDGRYGYDLEIPISDVPFFTSRYVGKPFLEVCVWEPTYIFCSKSN